MYSTHTPFSSDNGKSRILCKISPMDSGLGLISSHPLDLAPRYPLTPVRFPLPLPATSLALCEAAHSFVLKDSPVSPIPIKCQQNPLLTLHIWASATLFNPVQPNFVSERLTPSSLPFAPSSPFAIRLLLPARPERPAF